MCAGRSRINFCQTVEDRRRIAAGRRVGEAKRGRYGQPQPHVEPACAKGDGCNADMAKPESDKISPTKQIKLRH